MNRETAKRLLEVIKAYGEGKTIQYKARDTGRWCDWKDSLCSDCAFYDDIEYRIKPEENDECELPEPFGEKHYRPFKDCSELVNICGTKLIWIKSKVYGTENLITAFDNDNESIGGSCVMIQDIWVDMQELFDKFTFCDGSVCGRAE